MVGMGMGMREGGDAMGELGGERHGFSERRRGGEWPRKREEVAGKFGGARAMAPKLGEVRVQVGLDPDLTMF